MKTDEVRKVFSSLDCVKLAYMFGSQATGSTGRLSDHDFAVYLDGVNKDAMFDIRLKLMADLSRVLGTEAVDVIVLNAADAPELKYDIVSQGKLLFVREPYRLLVEPRIYNEYFDFRDSLRRYGLTRA